MQIAFTHDYREACALRDAGYEPIECAFGQYGSVLGEFALDHHGTESHREGVALRACRDLFGARRADPRFVVTGTPDADAVLAIIALAGLVPKDRIPRSFFELVNQHDTDPIGLPLLDSADGIALAWFNQRERLMQSEEGFRTAIGHMTRLLEKGLTPGERAQVVSKDRGRRRRASDGMIALLDRDGRSLPFPTDPDAQPVRRGAAAVEGAARILVVRSVVWGFDLWYRLAPVVVSYAERMAKVTVGCPDGATADALFGPGGLDHAWPALGKGWGGRGTIGGSPRGDRLSLSAAPETAQRLLPLLRA